MLAHTQMPQQEIKAPDLHQWVRSFAQKYYNLVEFTPGKVLSAAKKHLPTTDLHLDSEAGSQEILESILSILAIIKLGDQQIAWSIASDLNEAQKLQQTYSAQDFTQLRHSLGINAQWILVFVPELLFTQEDVYEAHMKLIDHDCKPDCAIVHL